MSWNLEVKPEPSSCWLGEIGAESSRVLYHVGELVNGTSTVCQCFIVYYIVKVQKCVILHFQIKK